MKSFKFETELVQTDKVNNNIGRNECSDCPGETSGFFSLQMKALLY